jgi:hypothetical protein
VYNQTRIGSGQLYRGWTLKGSTILQPGQIGNKLSCNRTKRKALYCENDTVGKVEVDQATRYVEAVLKRSRHERIHGLGAQACTANCSKLWFIVTR